MILLGHTKTSIQNNPNWSKQNGQQEVKPHSKAEHSVFIFQPYRVLGINPKAHFVAFRVLIVFQIDYPLAKLKLFNLMS